MPVNKLNTLDGNDVVQIEANGDAMGLTSVFSSRTNINLGADNDTLMLGIAMESGNSAEFDSARFDGSRGNDTIDYLNHGNIFVRPATVSGFETES